MNTPIKWGSEFLVNTTTAQGQSSPTITALADGLFVVAWTDASESVGDTDGPAIRAQIFNADGSGLGAEFLVNTTTTGSQTTPTITALADGGFVVAWNDFSLSADDADGSAVRGQRYGADGHPAGNEFLVPTTTLHNQINPNICALPDGGFVVAWVDESSLVGDTNDGAVRAQRYNADGSRSGSEFLVNTSLGPPKFHHKKGEVHYVVKNGDATVEGDVNGDGKADFAILLNHVTSLAATDFDL